MLDEVRIVLAHGDHHSRVCRERVPWAEILDVGTGRDGGRRGEGFVDRWEDPAWDCEFGFFGSVPVLVVHASAVSVLER